MSWSINLNGHKGFNNEDDHRTHEEELVRRAKEFVKTLKDDGISSARFTGNYVNTDLREE